MEIKLKIFPLFYAFGFCVCSFLELTGSSAFFPHVLFFLKALYLKNVDFVFLHSFSRAHQSNVMQERGKCNRENQKNKRKVNISENVKDKNRDENGIE